MDELDRLLDQVRAAPRLTRIEYRDRVAAAGAAGVAAMADWIGNPAYSRFAVRVLERIGASPEGREAAVDALLTGREDAESPEVVRDIDEILGRLGIQRRRVVASRARRDAPPGRPGQAGRHYWAMRTSQHLPDFIWDEVGRGRLRHGWGWTEEQDLRRIDQRRRAGAELSVEEQQAWRAHRMLATERTGMRPGDLVVTQNLPRAGRISVCRVVGAYVFELPGADGPEDYGHILPVELAVGDIDACDGQVSEALRNAISLRPRLYDITPFGGDVEALL